MRLAVSVLWLALASAVPGTAQVAPDDVVRPSADYVQCPDATEMTYDEAPDGSRSARWCQMTRGGLVARHGPYLELYADGSTARQGVYLLGVQAGQWASWTPDGRLEQHRILAPGESSRYIPQPEDLCPPGSVRNRSTGHDHKKRMWSKCEAKSDDGESILVGPSVTWDQEMTPQGPRYKLRQITHYDDDERHGPNQIFDGHFGRERLVVDETYEAGSLQGESREFYMDGALREQREYVNGRFVDERVAYFADGSERWRIEYDNSGSEVSREGDFTVAGQPCPDRTIPMSTPDGLTDFCGRRSYHFVGKTGPFVERDESGRVVTSGLYKNGEVAELWTAPLGVELPPEVPDDVLVAEIRLMVGDEPYDVLNSPPAEESAAGSDIEAEPPFKIWFLNNKTRKYPNPRTEVADGVVRVYGLPPGSYYMKTEIDADTSNDLQWPGDLFSSTDFPVRLDEVTQAEALLLHSLRLLEPWDNNEKIPGWGEACTNDDALLPSPVHFRWKPATDDVYGVVEYHYVLSRYSCDPAREQEVIAMGSTTDLLFVADLPRSKPGESYWWTLVAKRNGKAIGQMMTFGNGYGWNLSFRVR